MTDMTLPLPWPKPPMTLNQMLRSINVKQRAAMVADVKGRARWAIRAAAEAGEIHRIVGCDLITLHYVPEDRRRRDADGPMPTLKAVIDALVAEEVLPADHWPHVCATAIRFHEPVPRAGRTWVELTGCTDWLDPVA